jgi:integrase
VAWIERAPSGGWRASWRDPGGRKRHKTFPRKADAERFLTGIEHSKNVGTYIEPAAGQVRLRRWVEQWWPTTMHLRPSSRARAEVALRSRILPRFGDFPIAAVRTTDVRAFVAELVAAGASPGSVRKAFYVLSSVMRSAEESGLVGRSPCSGVSLPAEEPAEERYLAAEELERLAGCTNERYKALVVLAGFSGLRFGELAGLEVAKLDLLRRRITVDRTIVEAAGRLHPGPTKTRQRRAFALPQVVSDALAEHLAAFPLPTSGLVFTNPAGGPLRRTNFRRRFFQPAVVASGLQPLRFHDLRHTAASLMAANGYQLHEVAAVLGHSTIVTTRRYAHLFASRDEELAAKLDAHVREARELRRAPSVPPVGSREPTSLRFDQRESAARPAVSDGGR